MKRNNQNEERGKKFRLMPKVPPLLDLNAETVQAQKEPPAPSNSPERSFFEDNLEEKDYINKNPKGNSGKKSFNLESLNKSLEELSDSKGGRN